MKLTELEKLKYWIDTEFSILHIMFAVIMLQLVEAWWIKLGFGVYIVFTAIYILTRLAYLASNDPNFLKVPKK